MLRVGLMGLANWLAVGCARDVSRINRVMAMLFSEMESLIIKEQVIGWWWFWCVCEEFSLDILSQLSIRHLGGDVGRQFECLILDLREEAVAL